MPSRKEFALCHRPWHHRTAHPLLQHALAIVVTLTIFTSTLSDISPARAQSSTSSAFHVTFAEQFFGTQALSAKADDLSHPDHARFTVTNKTELWYSVRTSASSDALKPVAATPPNDLMSEAMVESGLLMPSSIIPVNPDLSLYQPVTLESHFSRPDQQVTIELDPFTNDAAAMDCVRLVLLLVGQDEVAQEAGVLVPDAIKEIVREFHNASDLTALVNDFVALLTAFEQGTSLVGPGHAVVADLLAIAGNTSELEILGAALGKAVGKHINLNPLKVVLGILDGAKYITDLIRSFGAYLFLNGNYPTITLQTVAPKTPIPSAKSQWNLGSDPGTIASGPDGNLWFTEFGANQIGRITPGGRITEFPIPTANSYPLGITSGPDGNVWFTEEIGDQIGRITPTGQITEFAVPKANGFPKGITAGPDGNLWFVEGSNQVGRITPDGQITEFPIPTVNSLPLSITTGADGNLWFTELGGEQIGRITPDGQITEFPFPATGREPLAITAGPDGNLWFTETTVDARGVLSGSRIGRITPDGQITEFPLPTTDTEADAIATGLDNNLWFVDWGATGNSTGVIGRITPRGSITFPVPGFQSAGLISLQGVTTGWDGNLWFTGEASADGISANGVILRIITSP